METPKRDDELPKYEGEVPAAVRRQHILSFVRAREFVRVSDLSSHFGVSEVTVRGDLDRLEKDGRVRRVRGGAMAREAAPRHESPFEVTQGAYAAQKAIIGQVAASLVSPGETILLDVGTTTTAVARALIAREELYDLIIFTPSLNIALELEPAIPRFTVVVTGGTLRPMQHSLVDPLGGLMLERIKAHTAFIGCNGFDLEGGITNINLPEAQIKRYLLRAVRRIVVADGSKAGTVELAYLCDVDDIDILITDDSADQTIIKGLRDRKVEVLIAH